MAVLSVGKVVRNVPISSLHFKYPLYYITIFEKINSILHENTIFYQKSVYFSFDML